MSHTELANLAKLTISKPREPVSTDGLWTARNPILLPPSPIPGQHNAPIPNQSSDSIFPWSELGLCANGSGDVYLYGGDGKSGPRDVLYHYSITDNTITPLQCWGDTPGDRMCHAMACVGNVIALHGGLGAGDDPDLYLLNLDSRKWSKFATFGESPGALRRHTMTAVGTVIYVFSGYKSDSRDSDKLWAFDLDTLNAPKPIWELVKPSSQTPPFRIGATLVSYDDRLILFGGYGSYVADVWSFDPKSKKWSELQCTGDIPPSRAVHTATILDDVMYIFGGSEFFAFLSGDFKDIFALKIPGRRWFKLKDTKTAPILTRCYHASMCIGTKIFIFGGDLGTGVSEEHPIHILDANYINNPALHTPERLNEIDAWSQVMRSQGKSEKDSRPQETETSKRSQIISHILEYPSKMESLAQLQRADAQMIVDFLADELGRQDIVQSNTDKRHILHFLTKLAKSSQVFPKSTELSDVQCILTTPVNVEGGYGFIYKGVFRDQTVCVKAVRVIGSSPKAGKRARASKKSQTGEVLQADKVLRAQAGETVLLAHVSHPNVIPLYGAYLSSEDSPRICIVSPWMENGDLVAYLGKFPDTPIIPLASDMASGMAFLHDMGIIHADLKARNVLVSRSQRAMLADFGIATVFHTNVGMTTASSYAGTTWWMAPELLVAILKNEPPPPTKESDIWGFACICYEMFTGEIPFVDRGYMPLQLMLAFSNGRRITPLRPNEESDPIDVDGDPISINDEPWIPLAERCWSYEPGERPTAADALQFLTDLSVPDDRPLMDEEFARFEDIKNSRAKIEIDYSHVLSIVRNVSFEYSGVRT